MVDAGIIPGPRIYATGPGVFANVGIGDQESAMRYIKRYRDAYQTNTLNNTLPAIASSVSGSSRRARNTGATVEGNLDLKQDLTQMIDGYSGKKSTACRSCRSIRM
jgi:hypothetical protein